MTAKLRGNALRHIREARGLTQAQLALATGVKAARISELERRLPRIWSRLCRLADVLDCTVDAILGRPASAHALVPVDVLAREDRKLLAAMERCAKQIVGPQVMRLARISWRNLAAMAFAGHLWGLRDGTTTHGAQGKHIPLRLAPPLPKPPKGWHKGWESDRQREWRQRDWSLPAPTRKRLARGRS